ncbi:MAG TPA: hypothetical protein VFR81_09725, partial [Longimicrobium sp.]|nr:hypothetical protein [Longimicrobium sp.]
MRVMRIVGMVIAGMFAVAGGASAQLPVSPLAVAHGVEGEGTARYRDPPVNFEGRYIVIALDEHRLYVMEDE